MRCRHLYSVVSSGFFDQIQEKAEEEMKSITLQDILDRYQEKTVHLGKISFWSWIEPKRFLIILNHRYSLLDIPEKDLKNPVFPGVQLSLNLDLESQISFRHGSQPYIMEISHCSKGRIGWDFSNGTSAYLGTGDLSLHSASCRKLFIGRVWQE